MYQLLDPQKFYNKKFLEQFAKENEDPSYVTQTWRSSGGKLKQDKTGMYSMASISPPHSLAASMIYRLSIDPIAPNFYGMAPINRRSS